MKKILFLALVGIISGCANNIENRINRDLAAAYVSIEKVYALCLQATPLNKIADCGSEYIYNLNRLPPHPQLAVELRYANKLYVVLTGMQKKKTKDWNTYNEINNKFIAEYNEEIKVALVNGNYVSNYPGSYSSSPSASFGSSSSSSRLGNSSKAALSNTPPPNKWTPFVDSSGNNLGRVDTGGGFNSNGAIYDNNGNYSGRVNMEGGFNSNGSVYDKNGNYIGKVAPK
jgi:hypothetical protein